MEWTNQTWENQVIGHGVDLLDTVIDGRLHHLKKAFSLTDDRDLVEEHLLEGDTLTRYFLAWYLEQTIDGVVCETESQNDISEPDIYLYERGALRANIEIKRVVSTTNITGYATSFIENDWHAMEPGKPSVLLLYFPLLITTEWRARTLVNGYMGFIKDLPTWDDTCMYVRAIPAPINSEKEFGALESTGEVVEQLKDI